MANHFSEADDAGHVFRARPALMLLPAAVQQRLQACAASRVQRADAFRTVEFVRGDGEQIHRQVARARRQFARGLDGVGVEDDTARAAQPPDLRDGLDSADLIIRHHH
ncbi:MAG: hypothetical protein BWY76_01458 [bacterium ADurb.Bin429]|nr:MAG: hypothetical protein BWY76_01453 [bacterium ADurb.Bin429]OPZ85340.1 MAG: hypothetical protein BWY76_01458 [bacterium ADurb.Bin429]